MQFNSFLLALSFLSRIAPAREADEQGMASAVKYFSLAGLVLGLALAAPFAIGLGAGKPLLQGVVYILIYLWLTRALHLDGLADLFDALGSGKHGEEFTAVLKDSRVGVFGVAAIMAALIAMTIGVTYSLEFGRWPVLVWAVVMGRAMVAPLARLALPAAWTGLGRMASNGATDTALALSLLLALALGLLCAGLSATFLVFLAAAAILLWLSRIANREGGLNGDYFGAAIVLTEISTLIIMAWLY